MGSSTASETTINTSTDSANTMLTMVTTTDGEQPDDSFDLVDIPNEMSPTTAPSQHSTVPPINHPSSITAATATASTFVPALPSASTSPSPSSSASATPSPSLSPSPTPSPSLSPSASLSSPTSPRSPPRSPLRSPSASPSTTSPAPVPISIVAPSTGLSVVSAPTLVLTPSLSPGAAQRTESASISSTSPPVSPASASSSPQSTSQPAATTVPSPLSPPPHTTLSISTTSCSVRSASAEPTAGSRTRRQSERVLGSQASSVHDRLDVKSGSNGERARSETTGGVGGPQDGRGGFVGGRTPPLPDLRATDFFSTPVRGSVDAGQPDSRSALPLLLAKEKQGGGARVDFSGDRRKHESDGKRGHRKKPSVNVTTNPLDITMIGTRSSNDRAYEGQETIGTSTKPRGRASAGGNAGGRKRTTQTTTIVVQQPSLSLDAPAATAAAAAAAATILLHPDADVRRREENVRQLLDVANTLTLQEIYDFEMRYGSPHHSRSQSVKTPGSRSSGRPNYLCLPQQRSRVASMPNTGVEEEYYRLRHFSITGKGVVNRGDSLKSRRSRSNNSVASSNSSTEHLTASYPGSARNSAAGSLASSRESSASQGSAPYRVLMLGAPAVGKSSLVSQFMTSEHLHAYDTSIDDESGEKTVSVLLAGEESELTFIDHSCAEMTPENCMSSYEPHAYCVVYSTTDRTSVRVAEEVLQTLWRSDHVSARAVILVGNKVDLVRSRLVSTEEGKSMATSYDCKFIETSVGINHNVDELLVGLLTQIRLKLENPERTRDHFRKRSRKNRSKSPLGSCSENNSPKKYRGSRTSTSLKVRHLLDRVWARDSKSKSCENLHIL